MGKVIRNGITYLNCNTGNIILKDYLHFNDECLLLPFSSNSNHKIACEFQLDSYVSQLQILGNTSSSTSRLYLGLWNGAGQDRIYTYNGSGEVNQILSDYTTKHTFIANDSGKYYMDDVQWTTGSIYTDANCFYTIGYRGADHKFIGKIFSYKIYDQSALKYVCDLKPAEIQGYLGLYDVITHGFYRKVS